MYNIQINSNRQTINVKKTTAKFDIKRAGVGPPGPSGGDSIIDIAYLADNEILDSNTSWQDVPLEYEFQEAGDYIVNLMAGAGLQMATDKLGAVQVRLFNETTNDVVPYSTMYVIGGLCKSGIAEFKQINVPVVLSIDGIETIKLQAMITDVASLTVALVAGGDGDGLNVSRLVISRRLSE